MAAWQVKNFFFDDLVADPEKFLKDYALYCGIDLESITGVDYGEKINALPTRGLGDLPINDRHADFINHQINKFQTYVDRDLSHWKI